MANQDVRVSALQSARTLSTDDLALATVVDELSETGYTSKKITEGAKASQYLEAFTFANLNTSAKTIVGAINEAATAGGADEFIIHMTDTTVTETAADIIDAFDGGSEIWLESQITGETIKARLPLLAYISDSSQLALRFSGITYANNRYRYCDVQMLRSPEQIVGRQAINVTFAVIDDATTSASSVWSSQKTAAELADKAEIDDTAVSSSTAWSSSQIVSLLPTESASGAVASFDDGADDVPVKSLVANIDYKDTTGFNAVNITRTGTNLLNPNATVYYNYTINSDGTEETSNTQKRICTDYMPCGEGVTLTVSGGIVTPNENIFSFVEIVYYDKDKNYLGRTSNTYTNSPLTSTTPTGCKFIRYGEYHNAFTNATPAYFATYKRQLQIGATATAYDPYTGTTSTINLGGTIYGGSVDITNGTVTSTKAQDGTDLPDPVVTQISPTELSTLKGVNNIWADTGDVTVEYRADVQLYIDKKIAEAVGGNRSLSLSKSAPEEVKEEETKQEEQEGDENVNR